MSLPQNICKIVVTGTSGCGKTTLGKRLSECIGAKFLDLDELSLPTGRAAFMERMEAIMGQKLPKEVDNDPEQAGADPIEVLKQEMITRLDNKLHLLEVHDDHTIFAVVDQKDTESVAKVKKTVENQLLVKKNYR